MKQFFLVVLNEGGIPAEKDVRDDTQRPHIGLDTVENPLEDLRRNVAGRATLRFDGIWHRRINPLGEPKVSKLESGIVSYTLS